MCSEARFRSPDSDKFVLLRTKAELKGILEYDSKIQALEIAPEY